MRSVLLILSFYFTLIIVYLCIFVLYVSIFLGFSILSAPSVFSDVYLFLKCCYVVYLSVLIEYLRYRVIYPQLLGFLCGDNCLSLILRYSVIFFSSCLQEGSCLIYGICVCLRIVVSNTYRVVLLFCFTLYFCTLCCHFLGVFHF